MGMVGVGLALLGGVVAASGKWQEGNAAQDLADYSADVLNYQAEGALKQGKAAVDVRQQQRTRDIGAVRAGAAAGNVDVNSGDAQKVQEDLAQQSAVDVLTIENNAALEAWGFHQQADVTKWSGKQQKKASQLAAFGTLLGGAAGAGASGSQSGLW